MRLRLLNADSTLPHLWPTGSSWVSPSITARYFSSFPSDPTSRWTPCPPKYNKQWLQVRLGCIQLSPSCPFRRLHTFCFLRPARNYPRFWIWRPSFERQRDFNPPEQHAAPRTQRALRRATRATRRLTVWGLPQKRKPGRRSCCQTKPESDEAHHRAVATLHALDEFADECGWVHALGMVRGAATTRDVGFHLNLRVSAICFCASMEALRFAASSGAPAASSLRFASALLISLVLQQPPDLVHFVPADLDGCGHVVAFALLGFFLHLGPISASGATRH